MFPTVLHSHQGDPRIHPGHNWMELRVTNAQVDANAAALTVPDNVRQATLPAVVAVYWPLLRDTSLEREAPCDGW